MPARAALAICLALAALHTWPLAKAPASQSLNYNADAEQWEWTLSWIARTLPRAPAHVFDANTFAHEPGTLAYSDPVIVPAALAAPVRWLGGSPVLTFNIALVTGLALTAWAGWFVAWRWTGSAGAGLVGGALAAFNTHLLTRLPHVQAAHSWGIPLAIYFADALVERPSWRTTLALAGVVAATAATSLYTLAFVGVIVGAACVVALPRWASAAAIAGGWVGGLVIAAPVLVPYAHFAASGASRPLEMVAQFSATPAAYLTSLTRLDAGWSSRFFRDEVNVLFAGIAAIALAIAGGAAAARDRTHRRRFLMLLLIAASGFVLSLGPSTALYRWVYAWFPPIRGLRAAARFGYLVLTVVALFAAIGVSQLASRVRSARTRGVIAAAALVIVTVEAWSGPVPTLPFSRVPAIYGELARATTPVTLVEVPFYPPEAMFQNGEYVLNATGHWQPVMNGYSGFIPDSYRRRADTFWFFPRDWAIDSIKREGATHIMVHLEKFTPDEVRDINETLRSRNDLRLIASDALGHRLYAIVAPGPAGDR